MKRLYFLTHSIDDADKMISDLRRSGVGEWHIHALSNDEAGLYHHHIHPAHFFQRYDIVHLGERGAMIGFLISIAWSFGIHYFQLIPASFGVPETVFTMMVFTLFGCWTGGLLGISRINYRIARFQKEIDSGACLVLVDTSRREEAKIRRQVRVQHTYAVYAGNSSTITNPFARKAKVT